MLIDFKMGHEAAFERVFKLYYKTLRLHAFLILKNEEEAEDQVQQLFLDIWNQQLYRNVKQSLKAYLHSATRNRCLNYLSKTKMELKRREEFARHARVAVVEGDEEEPLRPYLLETLNELSAQRFKAINLVHLEDKNYLEAAQEMGISINSLKSHLKLAVKFLRVRLKN